MNVLDKRMIIKFLQHNFQCVFNYVLNIFSSDLESYIVDFICKSVIRMEKRDPVAAYFKNFPNIFGVLVTLDIHDTRIHMCRHV